jgi:hypothetical protein
MHLQLQDLSAPEGRFKNGHGVIPHQGRTPGEANG